MATDNKRKLYDALSQDYDMGSYEKFCNDINDEAKRRKLYDATSQEYDFGTWENFSQQLGYVQDTVTARPNMPVTDNTTQQAAVEPAIETSSQQGKAQGWKPSAEDVAKFSNVRSEVDAAMAKTRDGMENVGRALERNSFEGRRKEEIAGMSARLRGLETRLPGLMPSAPPTGEGDNEGGDKPSDTRSPVPYNVVRDETGKEVVQWLMPDGSLTTDFIDADQAEAEARNGRLRKMFVERMVRNGLDPEKAEDVAAQQARDRLAVVYARGGEQYRKEVEDAYARKAGEGFWPYFFRVVGHNPNTQSAAVGRAVSGYDDSLRSEDANRLDAERRTLEKTLESYAARHLEKGDGLLDFQNVKNFSRGVWDVLSDVDTYAGGSREFQRIGQLMQIKNKVDGGEELSDRDLSLVQALLGQQVVESSGDTPHGYNAGRITAEMVPFMIQMAMNPASGLGAKLGQKMVRKFGQKAAKQWAVNMTKAMGKKRAAAMLKGVGVAGGDVASSVLLANTLQAPRTFADAAKRDLGEAEIADDGTIRFVGDQGIVKSFMKAEGAAAIENYTEMLGAHFGAIAGAVGSTVGNGVRKIGGGRLLDSVTGFMTRVKGTDWARAIGNVEKKAQWSGSVGEILEEEAGIVLNSLLVGDDRISDLVDLDKQIDIALGVGCFGAFVSGIKTVGYPIARHRTEKELRVQSGIGNVRFGERWSGISKAIDNCAEGEMGAVVASLIREHAVSDVQAGTILGYAKALVKARGYNLAAQSLSEGGMLSEYERGVAAAHDAGYEASSPREMNDAQNMYEYQQQRLVAELASTGNNDIEEMLSRIDADPIGALRGEMMPQMREIVRDYINAKSVRDGMMQRVNDDIDEQIARSDAMTDARVNPESGMIHPAVMGVDERKVDVVGGRLALNGDGTVDRDASDKSIIVRDAATGKVEFVDPKQIVSVGDAMDPETEKAVAADEIRRRARQAAEDAMRGALALNPGDVVEINDGGEQTTVTVVGPLTDEESGMPVEGQVVVQLADGQRTVMATERLQEMADAANLERLSQFEQERGAGRTEQLDAEGRPQHKYTAGRMRIRNSDGTETRGWLTGEVDENGNHEYYVEGDLRHLHYASEQELDGMISEYIPDKPLQTEAAQHSPAENAGIVSDSGENVVTSQYGNGPEQDNDERTDAWQTDGGRVAADSTGSVETVRDRSDIRVYEEGLAASRDEYSEYSERDRREAESERLVGIARQNGQYHERGDVLSRGERHSKNTGESEVVIDKEHGIVYKIKNPYAKSPMKGNVNPEDAIYEHLVHNWYFPETRYRFEGISEDLGEARIVLSQGYVESVGQPTKEQIEAALAERGLQPEGKYTYGNDEISVTDVTGDNALLGADGRVYFIDPIINFKKPVSEILGDAGENAEFSTENRDLGTESIIKGEDPVENVQQTAADAVQELTALQRIPRDAKGEPIFEQAENPEQGWDALVEFSKGDPAKARKIADIMVETKRKEYEKAQKLTPKGKTPSEILKSEEENEAKLAQAENEYNLWQKMAGVEQSRQNAIRSQQEAEARRLAAERAEAEKAQREARGEAARQEHEALEGIPEWHMDTPENSRKRGARRFSGQMYTRQEPVQGVVGNEVEVKFSQRDLPKGRVVVIEASQLQPSHVQGQRNPMFFIDEAQPKNRAEAVSVYAAKDMAEGIRPQEITGSATAYTGAPTVNARGEVIQGNNRSDALRFLWENQLPQQQRAYKQYLLDNAEQFGIDPEAVNAMQQPVLVNMIDVDDAEAIRLGQMTAQDTESGGIERIKPKNVAQKLGEGMRTFANRLLGSGDEDASFGQLVDRNGADVLRWMNETGAISNTQYQSAFDSKGNLTAEAKNDLQKVLYQTVFKGGSQQLEEMFAKLPAKAQRAILSTAFRDMDSPLAGKMLPEIQASIVAYNLLMSDPGFAGAKNLEQVLRAIEVFKRATALDDRFEQYVPADNFSNFALHLAGMYKASDMSQTTIASYFNQMYDLAQGKKAATLFEEADTTEYPLAEVIKKVLNIQYQPAKNGSNNVANGGADVALRNRTGQDGEPRGSEPPASREQTEAGAEPSERGGGITGDSRGSGNIGNGGESQETTQQERLTKEAASGIIAEMEQRATVAPELELTIENWDAQFGENGIVSTPIGEVKMGENQFTKLMRQGRNGKLGMIRPTLEDPDIIIEDASEAKDNQTTERESSFVFVKTFTKPDGSRYYYFTSVTVSKDGHEVVVSNQEKRRNVLTNLLMKGKLVWKHADNVSPASDLADGLYSSQGNLSDPASEGTDAPQTNNVLSDRKVTNSVSYKQENNAELQSMAARDGVPFQFTEELAKAEEKLSEYEDLMKAEMEAKEAKYAELDKDVEAASNIELTEEDSEDAASEPIASYSEENANFASRYETQDGKTINYTSENSEGYGGLFDFDFSGENAGGDEVGMRSGANDLQRQGDTGLNRHNSRLDNEAGEFSLIERVFRESGSFNFTSGEKIESADDVAFIFSALEDAAKEHSFVVLVKDGKPTVVELGMGTFTATMVDIPTASLAYNRIQPDQVYFVHNHPNGNLMCSPQDVQMLRKIADISKVPVYGVIINLKTGKYGTFDTDNTSGVGQKRVPENESPLAVHTLDKQIFAPNYDPMEQPLVRGSEDVAKFLNSQRMGDRAKMSFIILSRAGRIVGNIHTPFTKLPAKSDEIARYISERVIQFGGESAILYGDFTHEGSKMVAYRNLKDNLNKVGGTTLLDVVNVEGNNTRSANDDGLLYEPGSEYGASPESEIRYREVEDDAILTEFAEGKTVKAYRTMQVIDGKLYSPMATKVGGKATPEIKLGVPEQAEEHPEIIKRTKIGKDGVEIGYVVIDKGLGKGTLEVAYNPSIHASRTALNDQFTSAHIRPNLVTVEVEIPLSELTSGYRANMAKDAVGEISWHSGTVSGQLAELGKPRRVILSRYDRPVRIVPFREVAAMISEQLDGTDIAIPFNVVQPQVRAELERLGVEISEEATGKVGDEPDFGKAEYITDREIERINARQQEMAQTSTEAKSNHAERMSKKFNTPIRIVADPKELTSDNAERQARMRRSKGFYAPATGEVVVVLPNNATVEDVAETVFHEVVAHKGLREMIGEENYDAFCDEVYNHLKDDLKKQVDEETTRLFMNEPGKGYEHHRRVAVDELFGRMAEKGFEDFTKAEKGIWAKLKAKVFEAINRFLGALKLPKWVKLGDNELRYMLWRSHEKLRTKGDYVDMARDAAKREELGLRRNEAVREWTEETTADRIEKSFEAAISGDLKGKPVEVGKLTQEGREFLEKLSGIKMKENVSFVLNPSDLVHIYRRHYGVNEKDGRNIPLTKEDIRQMSEIVSTPDRIVYGKEIGGNQRNMFFFLKEAQDGSYNLMEIYSDKKGNLTAKSFFKSKEGVSQRVMLLNESSTLTSVTDGATLLDGAKLPKFFDNRTIDEGESFEYRFRNGETGDIWRDRSVGLEERITNAAIRLSANQSDDLTLRNDAMRAIGGNLTSLRKAMSAQRRFDQATVKRVADLARILMQNGYLSGMTSGEMQRLISAVKNSVGHKEVKESVQKIMDIMVGNQLRNGEATLRELLAIRGNKVDARGVEVQGALDVEGQRTMEVVKKAMTLTEDDITNRIAEALNRMSDPDNSIADQAAIEYAALHMAFDYVQNITNSKAEENALREELKRAKEDKDAGRMTDDAYKQFVETTEDAIRKNKIERAEAYFNLVGRLSDSLRGSIENAKAFREAEKERVNEIHHNANSDMEGRPSNEHHKDDWKDKLMNSWLVRVPFAPLATFDQIMRVFGNKSANGEGYLWNRFMRGWVDCRDKELLGVKEKFGQLDAKAAELFGKGKTWGSIISNAGRLPKMSVRFWDGGEMRDHELTQGNLLYIYMVEKMTDGRMKLRRMGITEKNVEEIENFLDPRLRALGDWLQDEFLVETRNEYNETHKRMFGASMAAIENYFPLKILENARTDKEKDVNKQNQPEGICTKTGSIVKRRVNNLALDLTGANALNVILNHITQMEHWNAYAEWNRDLNALRTYKRFHNQVINMTTVYGGGEKLWKKFDALCKLAAGEYRPQASDLNQGAVALARGVSSAKIWLGLYTALKQFLSAPAFAPEVNIRAITKSIANPNGDFKWCLENLPNFRERWHSRISGDPRLLKSEMDWNSWRGRIMEMSSRFGMTPNAFVDAVTVSIGARAMYETRRKQYLKEGYATAAAERRAKQDATILFNQTQQSSEAPFLSTMQVDKDWLSVLLTLFRNSSMSYSRQTYDAIRNLKRNLTPGQRANSVEFMTKQILRDWNIAPDSATDAERGIATDAARSRFRRQICKDVLRTMVFGFLLETLWYLGPDLPYLLLGGDDDEKKNILKEASIRGLFGSVEGLTGGDSISSFFHMWESGDWNVDQLSKDMPMVSDIHGIIKNFAGDKDAEAINDIINLVVGSSIGANPQVIVNTVAAIMDACGDDPALSHEAAIFVMRVLQVPQSQLGKLYFDEIGLSGAEASKLTPAQLAARYAEYQVKRGVPLAWWSWDDEERLSKYEEKNKKEMTARLNSLGDAAVNEAYADYEARYKAVSKQLEETKDLMETDYVAAQARATLRQSPDFILYKRFYDLNQELTHLSKMWLSAKTPEEASLIAATIPAYRAGMVKALQAETAEDQQTARSARSELMNDFHAKYQAMQPQPMQLP